MRNFSIIDLLPDPHGPYIRRPFVLTFLGPLHLQHGSHLLLFVENLNT